jgi:DUF4097 and DUF4098 domain-containing protein YvlB
MKPRSCTVVGSILLASAWAGPGSTLALLTLGAGATALIAGCASPSASFSESRESVVAWPTNNGSGALRVETRNGSIEVLRAERTDLRVSAEIFCTTAERLAATTLRLTAPSSASEPLLVDIDWANGQRQNNERANIRVEVPGGLGVTSAVLKTSNGAILTNGLSGPLSAQTRNGRITVTAHDGSVEAVTSNGRVEATGVRGGVKLSTSNGAIITNDVYGTVNASSSNGSVSVSLSDSSPGPVDISTSNGAINLVVGAAFSGRIKAATSNGGIRAGSILARELGKSELGKRSAELDLAPSGMIQTSAPASTPATSSLRTSNGSITIETRR